MNWLIGDIGATSSRCGIYSVTKNSTADLQVYRNEKFDDLQALLAEYLAHVPENRTTVLWQ